MDVFTLAEEDVTSLFLARLEVLEDVHYKILVLVAVTKLGRQLVDLEVPSEALHEVDEHKVVKQPLENLFWHLVDEVPVVLIFESKVSVVVGAVLEVSLNLGLEIRTYLALTIELL